jgi:hypothetical protein
MKDFTFINMPEQSVTPRLHKLQITHWSERKSHASKCERRLISDRKLGTGQFNEIKKIKIKGGNYFAILWVVYAAFFFFDFVLS